MSSRRMMMAYILTHQSRLPAEFQEVEWIGSDGTQYIDTGYKPNGETKCVASIITMNTANGDFFGARNGYANKQYHVIDWVATYKLEFRYASVYHIQEGQPLNRNQEYIIECSSSGLYVDNVQIQVETPASFQCDYNFFIFGYNNGGTETRLSTMKITNTEGLQLYENGTLVRNYIPCYRKADGVIGAYDLVNGVFYTNAWTGNFTKGADV